MRKQNNLKKLSLDQLKVMNSVISPEQQIMYMRGIDNPIA